VDCYFYNFFVETKNVTMLRNFKTGISYLWWGLSLGRQDVQYNDTWHNGTQHNIKTWHLMLCWVWFMLCLTVKLIAQCCHALCLYADCHILIMSQECHCEIIYMTSPFSVWHLAEWHYAEWHYAEWHNQNGVMLNGIIRMTLWWMVLSEWHYAECHHQNDIQLNYILQNCS
jgi:hypothetical protein